MFEMTVVADRVCAACGDLLGSALVNVEGLPAEIIPGIVSHGSCSGCSAMAEAA